VPGPTFFDGAYHEGVSRVDEIHRVLTSTSLAILLGVSCIERIMMR